MTEPPPEITFPAQCSCTPGTAEDGWHEQRCKECLQVERRIWARAISLAPEIACRLRRRGKR